MATRYRITVGDEEIEFEGPDNLSDEEITHLADNYLKDAKPGQSFSPSQYAGEVMAVDDPKRSMDLESSTGGAFLRNLPHDASFNWDDEFAGLANAAIPGLAALDNATGASQEQQSYWNAPEGSSFWDVVKRNAAANAAQQEIDRGQHPTASALGRVTGVLSSLPRAGAAVAARLPQAAREAMVARPILTGIGVGAGTGVASGAGAGEPGSRGQSAALGGLTGAALGGAVSGALELGPAVATYAKIFFNRGSDKEAIAQIIKSLQRDGFDVTSPSGVQALRQELSTFTDKPVSLADIGQATRSRTGVALRSPSNAQTQAIDRVYERAAGQTQRLTGDIQRNVAPRTDVHALEGDLIAQRAQQAQALRDKAMFEEGPIQLPNQRPQVTPEAPAAPDAGLRRAMGEDVPDVYNQQPPVPQPEQSGRVARMVDDPQITQLIFGTDAGRRALDMAKTLARGEYSLRAAQGLPVDDVPFIADDAMTVDARTLDYVKRFLDDEVGRLYKGTTDTFGKAELHNVKALRDALRERMRTAIPGYGDYLDAYRGSSEMIDALTEGQNFNRLAPEQIATQQGEHSTAAQELYRVGAARNLLDTLRSSSDSAYPASRILNSEEARSQLGATGVAPDALAKLNLAVRQERQFNLLPKELAGAQTNQRALATADANAGADFAIPFNPGSPISWAGMGARAVLNRTSVNRNAAVNEELLPRMLETDPMAVDSIIKELEDVGNIALARQLKRRAGQIKSAGVGGTLIGSPVALPAPEDDYGR